jgi:hypothetical protein
VAFNVILYNFIKLIFVDKYRFYICNKADINLSFRGVYYHPDDSLVGYSKHIATLKMTTAAFVETLDSCQSTRSISENRRFTLNSSREDLRRIHTQLREGICLRLDCLNTGKECVLLEVLFDWL